MSGARPWPYRLSGSAAGTQAALAPREPLSVPPGFGAANIKAVLIKARPRDLYEEDAEF